MNGIFCSYRAKIRMRYDAAVCQCLNTYLGDAHGLVLYISA